MFISQTTDFHFANYRFSFRKLQIFISQTTDFHFANYRFSFRKLQIFISQTTDFHFANYRFPFRFANYSKPAFRARRNGFFGGNFLFRISELTQRERICSYRKLQIFISQTTDSHFANYRFSFRKLQISISQTTDFHFVSSHFVSQTTVSLLNGLHPSLTFTMELPVDNKIPFIGNDIVRNGTNL